MTDEVTTVINLDKAVVSLNSALAVAVGVMAWWHKRQDKRITDLERDMTKKVDLETFNATLELLRRDIRESSEKNSEHITQAVQRCVDSTERVATQFNNYLISIADRKS